MTTCEHLHAAIEGLPDGWFKRLLEWAVEHAGCGDLVTPQSGGGGPTNPPEPPK